jgi:hypothetical protein
LKTKEYKEYKEFKEFEEYKERSSARWGENLGGPWIIFSPSFCRAGFEPRRG